jgi:hypothetical protein
MQRRGKTATGVVSIGLRKLNLSTGSRRSIYVQESEVRRPHTLASSERAALAVQSSSFLGVDEFSHFSWALSNH